MTTAKILSYRLKFINFQDVLELFKKDVLKNGKYRQIISINPENIMMMRKNSKFEKLVLSSQTLIVDGAGVVLAARLAYGVGLTRITGVDLMDKLVGYAAGHSLRCLLIGGKGNLAEKTRVCYQGRYPNLKIASTSGFLDISRPRKHEIQAIKTIVRTTRPHLVFIAFGSPHQELWIEANKNLFKGSLVMGVGGAFAMNSGALQRAPSIMRTLGLEWLFRLGQEPWRIKRQLNLIKFVGLVILDKLKIK